MIQSKKSDTEVPYSLRCIALFAIGALLLMAVTVFSYRADFFRGYTDEWQSSLGSADMHNLAWASYHNTGLVEGLLLAKRISNNGEISAYPHYTNGYPMLVGTYYRLVGDSLRSSRLFPLLSIVIGGFLFLATLVTREKISPAIFLSIPFLFVSSVGRDSASFELLEPAHFLALGVVSYLIYRNNPLLIKLMAIFVAISLYQVSFIFVGAIVMAQYLKSRNLREFTSLLCFLIFCMAAVLYVFASSSGWSELFDIIRKRSGLNVDSLGADESINLFGYLNSLFNLRLNQSINYIILAGAVFECFFQVRSGKYLLPCLVGSLLIYSLLFLNHTGAHYFTYLIYIYLILVAWIAFVQRLTKMFAISTTKTVSSILCIVMLVATYFSLAVKPRNYREDPIAAADYLALKKWEANNVPADCSVFEVVGIRTDSRIVSPFFAKYYGTNKAGRNCQINLLD